MCVYVTYLLMLTSVIMISAQLTPAWVTHCPLGGSGAQSSHLK